MARTGKLNRVIQLVTRLSGVVRVFLWLAAGYHYFLLLAGIFPGRQEKYPKSRQPRTRFAIAVPAHNESTVIGETVRHLKLLNYPSDLFEIVVVADYCTDNTSQVVRDAGGVCHERNEGPRGRKGYALAWLLERLVAQACFDAIVVLDADSQAHPDMLAAFDAALARGEQVLQGQHLIANPEDSVYNALASIDLRLNNRLRNLSRHKLGFSSRLMGDVMCFHIDVLTRFPWSTFSLTEDVEYGIHLMEAGVRIAYVPEALSYGEAAGSWQRAEKQRMRWEGGVLEMRRHLGRRLLYTGFRDVRPELIDRGIELLLPPYSVLSLFAVTGVLADLVHKPSRDTRLWKSAALAGAWITFPFWAMLLDRAPARLLWRGFLSGPLFLVWRVWIRIQASVRKNPILWVRTPRKAEKV